MNLLHIALHKFASCHMFSLCLDLYFLSVQEAPKLEIYPSSFIKARAGDSLTMQCNVIAGQPSPTVEWIRWELFL